MKESWLCAHRSVAAIFMAWHHGGDPLPQLCGAERGLPPCPSAVHTAAGCGEGQAAAGAAQLPSFSKEMRTFGWQGSSFHICSFRMLCCYSTPCDPGCPLPPPKSRLLGLAEARAVRVMGASPLPSGAPGYHPHDAGLVLSPCSGFGPATGGRFLQSWGRAEEPSLIAKMLFT